MSLETLRCYMRNCSLLKNPTWYRIYNMFVFSVYKSIVEETKFVLKNCWPVLLFMFCSWWCPLSSFTDVTFTVRSMGPQVLFCFLNCRTKPSVNKFHLWTKITKRNTQNIHIEQNRTKEVRPSNTRYGKCFCWHSLSFFFLSVSYLQHPTLTCCLCVEQLKPAWE